MKYFVPLTIGNVPLEAILDNEEYILLFENKKDINFYTKKSNKTLLQIITFNDADTLYNFLRRFRKLYRLAIITKCSEKGFDYEETILED